MQIGPRHLARLCIPHSVAVAKIMFPWRPSYCICKDPHHDAWMLHYQPGITSSCSERCFFGMYNPLVLARDLGAYRMLAVATAVLRCEPELAVKTG
jgi:hypothetical protein